MYGAARNRKAIGRLGNDVFLGEQLQAVGQRLQPAEAAADPGRAQPVLDPAETFRSSQMKNTAATSTSASSSATCTSAAIV